MFDTLNFQGICRKKAIGRKLTLNARVENGHLRSLKKNYPGYTEFQYEKGKSLRKHYYLTIVESGKTPHLPSGFDRVITN